ncbi:MAG TPA: hypothetical protein CFH84_06935 [Sulfurimonas sp. UBA12504]|nr:MAG: hypothetical protein A2019_07180 [Sulfurimonas sp. GWF2_37_8]DAB29928.1 MAG TPA: hypothetical protein CFH84_06935 [Sulfurimonas sp. UBA12504]
MSEIDLHNSIKNKDEAKIIDLLEDKSLNIEMVKEIYFAFKTHKEIVGQVAMNLSLRTSVYDRELEYSETIVELLRDLATNEADMGARWAVAKNPHTPADILTLLSKDEVNLVRALVATNPKTSPAVLEKFFSDEKIVRDGLSGNPSTPVKILKILANDADKMVRMRLAENTNATPEVLKELLEDKDENVAMAARTNLERQA